MGVGRMVGIPETLRFLNAPQNRRADLRPHVVVGITHPQTCLNLTGRLSALREAGFRVTLVSSPGEWLDRTATREGVDATAIPMRRRIAPLEDMVSLIRLYRLLRRLQPDLAEFSTPKAGLLGVLAAWLSDVPVRVYMLRGLKLERCVGLKRRILLAMEWLTAACAHVVLCNSGSLRDEARGLGVAPAAKLFMLGDGSTNGVNVERFAPGESSVRCELGISAQAPVVGFVGRLTRDKGIPELIEAFDRMLKTVPEARLLLVGWFDASDDALCSSLRARIERHRRIHCTGFVSDTAPYYRAMDLMILPSWREGFPNVVLEAAATGIPVITTMATGSRDSVVPEITGLLVPPGQPEALSTAALKLLHDPEKRRKMGETARAWVVERYRQERVLGLVTGYYTRLVRRATGELHASPIRALEAGQD